MAVFFCSRKVFLFPQQRFLILVGAVRPYEIDRSLCKKSIRVASWSAGVAATAFQPQSIREFSKRQYRLLAIVMKVNDRGDVIVESIRAALGVRW